MDEELDEAHAPTRYISDNTAFMRWSTEVEQIESVIDKEFLENNHHRIADIDKFLPLSNLNNPRQIQLLRQRRINMGLAKDAGLIDVADETVIDNWADCQTSRGVEGFYQNALITQKREWLDKSPQSKEKKGIFKRIFKLKKDDEMTEHGMEE